VVAELLQQQEQQQQDEHGTSSTCMPDLLAQYVSNVDLEELVRIPLPSPLSKTSKAPLSAGLSGLAPCVQSPTSKSLRPLNLFGDRAANEIASPLPLAPSSPFASASLLDNTDLLQRIAERARQIERDVSAANSRYFQPLAEGPVCRVLLSLSLSP
jgi:hypothetical protein